jgi:Uma2 family endonuclease
MAGSAGCATSTVGEIDMSTNQLLDDIDPADVFDGIYYPSSDDKPMAESDLHAQAMMELYNSIDQLFAGREDVAYHTDMFLYYEEGRPKARNTPDVMVIPGAPRDPLRRSFRIWAEGVVPAVIFEVTSKKTRKTDWTVKKRLYRKLGVKEYFLFDPLHDYQRRQLMGFRLVGGRYVAIKRQADGSLRSEVLGVRLYSEGYFVRFVRMSAGKRVPFRRELHEALLREDQEHLRAEQEQRRADQQRRRAEAAEQELARLRSQLRQRGRGNGRG